jgi:hypothetical protein
MTTGEQARTQHPDPAPQHPVPTSTDLESRLDAMTQALSELTADMRARQRAMEPIHDLVSDLAPVSHQAMSIATQALADLERRGYGEFTRAGFGVVDRIVGAFGKDDVEALGANIVLILETVKEMTQPEVMTMLRRTASLVREQRDEPVDPPSLLGILNELRDRDVRRGLDRMVRLLRSVGREATEPARKEA